MKQVITNPVIVPTVSVEAVVSNKFYGVQVNTGPAGRGFITREKYDNGKFTIRCSDGLTYANGWDGYDDVSLKQVIEKVLNSVNSTMAVFEFDTFKELMEWVVEKH